MGGEEDRGVGMGFCLGWTLNFTHSLSPAGYDHSDEQRL
jgi:hypothetical protein